MNTRKENQGMDYRKQPEEAWMGAGRPVMFRFEDPVLA